MGDAKLVADSSIRGIKALTGDVSIGVGCIVCIQPSMNKDLLCSVGRTGGGGASDIIRELL